MADRRRVRNAVKCEYDGIAFESKLEAMVYKTLTENGITPQYECESFMVTDRFIPKIPFITKNHFTRKNKHIEVLSTAAVIDRRPIDGIVYTPDFIFTYGGKTIIIEAKGMPTEAYKYRFKLFRLFMEKKDVNVEIWEIFTKRQLIDCIKRLKENENTL